MEEACDFECKNTELISICKESKDVAFIQWGGTSPVYVVNKLLVQSQNEVVFVRHNKKRPCI